ncbi:MAG: GGDEF domain-containing protein, partial [Deltaproteobacteria bacterium]|nr:GGDEF domain-containing protein [Deltaproteobacteria bacterium]
MEPWRGCSPREQWMHEVSKDTADRGGNRIVREERPMHALDEHGMASLLQAATAIFEPAASPSAVLQGIAEAFHRLLDVPLALAMALDGQHRITDVRWSAADSPAPSSSCGIVFPEVRDLEERARTRPLDLLEPDGRSPQSDPLRRQLLPRMTGSPWVTMSLEQLPELAADVRALLPQVRWLNAALLPAEELKGEACGVVLVGSNAQRPPLQEQAGSQPAAAELLRLADRALVSCWMRQRTFDQLGWMKKIHRLFKVALSTVSFEDLLERLLLEILGLTGGDDAYFVSNEGQVLAHVNSEGIQPVGGWVSAQVMQQCQGADGPMVLLDGGEGNDLTLSSSSWCFRLRSAMVAPVKAGDERIGLVYVSSRIQRREYKSVDLGVLSRVLEMAAQPIANARVVAKLCRRMEEATRTREAQLLLPGSENHDFLTGLLGRAQLMDQLQLSFDQAQQLQRRLTCALLDLDNFKMVNDRFGHRTGDLVLEAVGKVLRGMLRSSDVVGRYGGEEFLLVMPGASLRRGCEVAQRVRKALECLEISLGEKGTLRITGSIGLAELRPGISSPAMLAECADRALLYAKAAGKNCVCYYADGQCREMVEQGSSSPAEADLSISSSDLLVETEQKHTPCWRRTSHFVNGEMQGLPELFTMEESFGDLCRHLQSEGSLLVFYFDPTVLTCTLEMRHRGLSGRFLRWVAACLHEAGQSMAASLCRVVLERPQGDSLLMFLSTGKRREGSKSFDLGLMAKRLAGQLQVKLGETFSMVASDDALQLGYSIALSSPLYQPERALYRGAMEAQLFREREVQRLRNLRVITF